MLNVNIPPSIRKVFRRLNVDGYLSITDMGKALDRLGYGKTFFEWVHEAFLEAASGAAVNLEEFYEVVKGYDERLNRAMEREFARYDLDMGGQLEAEEFAEVLRSFGIEPLRHCIAEAIREVDLDEDNRLDMKEFAIVVRLLREREGFSAREVESFSAIFLKFDLDGSGDMDSNELCRALVYLGYKTSPVEAVEIAHEVDHDRSGTIDEREFLVCMRKVREREIHTLKTAMDGFEVDSAGMCNIAQAELKALLDRIGYYADDAVMEEVGLELGIDFSRAGVGGFDLSKLWQYLAVFRERDGLCRAELKDIEAGFKRYATTRKGSHAEVFLPDIPKFLRFMGYRVSFAEQQLLMKRVDIDNSGSSGVVELRKLVRMCRDEHLDALQQIFRAMTSDDRSYVTGKEAVTAYESQGISVASHQRLAQDQHFDLHAFLRTGLLLDGEHRKLVQDGRAHFQSELVQIKQVFDKHDVHRTGRITNSSVVDVVEEALPKMTEDQKLLPQFHDIVLEVETHPDGVLSFDDFLRLIGSVRDVENGRRRVKEREALEASNFAQHEVKEFRELFTARAKDGRITAEAFRQLLAPVCPPGSKHGALVQTIWSKVTHPELGEEERMVQEARKVRSLLSARLSSRKMTGALEDTADFPEFLYMMRAIVDANIM